MHGITWVHDWLDTANTNKPQLDVSVNYILRIHAPCFVNMHVKQVYVLPYANIESALLIIYVTIINFLLLFT